MFKLIGFQFAPTAAYESAFAEVCLQPSLCPNQADPSPSLEMVRISYDNHVGE